MDAMDLGAYSRDNVTGNPSLEALHSFDGGTADLVFTFSPPVNDPELHIARLGGYSGWEPLIYSHTSRITLGNDLTWAEAAGNGPHFVTTSNTVYRTTGTLLERTPPPMSVTSTPAAPPGRRDRGTRRPHRAVARGCSAAPSTAPTMRSSSSSPNRRRSGAAVWPPCRRPRTAPLISWP